MILSALNRYYNILLESENCNIPRADFSSAKVDFAFVISEQGDLLNIVDLRIESKNAKKPVSQNMIVPERRESTNGICPNFMCANSKYVLGCAKDKPERSKEAFLSFRELHNKILDKAEGRQARAVTNFLNKWDIEKARECTPLKEKFDEIINGGNIVFRLDGELKNIQDDDEVKKLWIEYNKSSSEDRVMGQCLITGQNSWIQRLHPRIKGVKEAQTSGAAIVSFNDSSYESYGKEQNYNAPVGKMGVFAYCTVLNYMLSNQKHIIQVGDATTVFWAESTNEAYIDMAAELLNPHIKNSQNDDQKVNTRDVKIENLIKDVLAKSRSGEKISDLINDLDEKVDKQTNFYILGLSPNAGRISIRYFYRDSFGGFITKILQHYSDIEIASEYSNNPINGTIYGILRETIPHKSSEKDVQPLLGGAVMRAILNGGMYPQILFNSIMQRLKNDRDDDKDKSFRAINHTRVAVIKAILLRKSRITKNNYLKEVLSVSLNEQTSNKAYLLGRLFAVIEKTQKAGGNETVRDRYFTSACTTPATVFPILVRLAQHHISKLSNVGKYYDRKIADIVNRIDEFPTYLGLDDQGLFVLGYYQQKVKMSEEAKEAIEQKNNRENKENKENKD